MTLEARRGDRDLTDERPRDPRCTGACTDRDRPAYDPPAKPGKERGTGRKLIYCPCCNHELLAEETLKPEQRMGVFNVRPPNLNPALQAGKHKRFYDLICRYEVVVLWDVTEIK